jgi:hypothetical protein
MDWIRFVARAILSTPAAGVGIPLSALKTASSTTTTRVELVSPESSRSTTSVTATITSMRILCRRSIRRVGGRIGVIRSLWPARRAVIALGILRRVVPVQL